MQHDSNDPDSIVITEDGDRIKPFLKELGPHWGVPGIHEVCKGEMAQLHSSKTTDCLVCKYCGLRVTFPVGIVTADQLRDHFKELNPVVDPD